MKKSIFLFFVLLSAIAYTNFSFAWVEGDLNGDAIVNNADTILALQISTGMQPVIIPTVTSAGGQVWMDRNLGASRVATSADDVEAYGYLYQWGRDTDGHQYRTSPTTTDLCTSDTPGHWSFIIGTFHWQNVPASNSYLWREESDYTNNPCPVGFRIPTSEEWNIEIASWAEVDSVNAFNSPLKLVAAGIRDYSLGEVSSTGLYGFYWTSDLPGQTGVNVQFSDPGQASWGDAIYRASGLSVRCIKK